MTAERSEPNDEQSDDLSEQALVSAEDMDELPEGIRESIVSYVRKVSYEHRGPLPAPQTLREYEQILPGVADRIVSQAERQSAHRMELERTVVTSEGRRSWAGWASATLIGVGVLVAAVVVTVGGLSLGRSRLRGFGHRRAGGPLRRRRSPSGGCRD